MKKIRNPNNAGEKGEQERETASRPTSKNRLNENQKAFHYSSKIKGPERKCKGGVTLKKRKGEVVREEKEVIASRCRGEKSSLASEIGKKNRFATYGQGVSRRDLINQKSFPYRKSHPNNQTKIHKTTI